MTQPRLTLPNDPEMVTLRRSTLVLLIGLTVTTAVLFLGAMCILIHITRCPGGMQ